MLECADDGGVLRGGRSEAQQGDFEDGGHDGAQILRESGKQSSEVGGLK